MPRHSAKLIGSIRTMSAALEIPEPDAALVERFARQRDEAAFQALIERHGPMVLRLCRRLLPCEQDAEDAFQATFLVLARKTAAIRKFASVGPWLYGVAYRIAMKSRSSSRRREKLAQIPVVATPTEPLDQLSVREAEALLLEELGKLPGKFRDPLVLCHLEGRTRDEAARDLGCPLGTLKERLLRGKEALHLRLVKRGVTLSGALTAGLLSEVVCPAAVGAPLTESTLRAAIAPVKPLSDSVAVLVSEGARSLGATRIKMMTWLTAATFVVGLTAGVMNLVSAAPATNQHELNNFLAAHEAPPDETKPQLTDKRVDIFGDPLPDGAIKRLGTTRSRRIDAKSIRTVERWSPPEGMTVNAYSPDGRYALASNQLIFHTGGFRIQGAPEPKQECKLTLYDVTARKEVWSNRQMLEPKDWDGIGSCGFSSDGKCIAMHTRSGIRFLEAQTGKILWEHRIDAGQSLSIFGFADGDKLLIVRGTYNGYLYVIDCATGKEVRSFSTAIFKQPGRATLSPDHLQILVCGSTEKPRVWDLTGKELPPLEGHKKWVSALTFSADGKKVYTGGSDDFVIEREWPSGKVLRSIDLGRSDVEYISLSGDGQHLEVIFWGERAIAFYDLPTGKRIPDLLEAHRSGIYGVAFAPDGSLVSFARDETVRTWDLKLGKATGQFKVERELNAGGFALSPDGKRVAVPKGNIDGIHVYERATGRLLGTINADHSSMKQLFFSPDGKFLAAINTDRGVAQVWATDSGNQVLKYTAKQVAYNATAGTFSPDGRLFAFSDCGGVRFWNTANWKEEKLLTAYGNVGLAFSPDGRMLATADIDGVRIYELSTKREREYSRPNDYASGSLRFSPGGRFLAWVAQRATIHVLDLYTGVRLGPFSGQYEVSGLAFTADDKALASSSADSTILIWDIAGAAAKHSYQGGYADQAWQTLGSDDAKVAFAALRALAASPEQALRRIGDRIKPAKPLDKDWVAARLNDLDNEKFAERDRATRELEEAGERTVPFLEKLLSGKPSVEARERAERLVAKLRSPASESERTAQIRRGLELLEWIGNASARELVEILAEDAERTALTEEAKATLRRWRQ